MSENIKQAVDKLNDAIFMASEGHDEYVNYLEYVATPIGDYIKFMGHYLWSSENDMREYTEDEYGERIYQTIGSYIRDEIASVSVALDSAFMAVNKSIYGEE